MGGNYLYICMYIYQSQNLTVASARNWRVCRQGRRGQGAVEDRAGEDMAGQGRAGGHIKSGQSKSRAGRGQKAGQGMMGILQYE